jgi:hypothetical protein
MYSKLFPTQEILVFFFAWLQKAIHMEGVSQQTLSPWHASDRDGLLPPGWGKSWVVSPYNLSSPKSDPDAEGVFGDG